jgi:CheY-like chemotaxis protein
VLVADDDAGMRESLGKLLRQAGCDVALAGHGGEALAMLFQEPFDLVILDLNMPHMDGWETLDRIQNLRPGLPVIVLTAQPNQRQWTCDAGARVLMEKPFHVPLLLDSVHDLLREAAAATDSATGSVRWFKHLPPLHPAGIAAAGNRSWGINE